VNQVEPVLCHAPETLELVRLARSIDEALRRTPEAVRARVRADLDGWIERGREIAREAVPI
jgi:hypothetical protein